MIVDKLKASILQKIFEGQVTNTLDSDKSVSESLKLIEKQKKELEVKYNSRKEPNYKCVSEDEKLFIIPNTWEWYRIGQLGIFKKGPFGSALTKSIFVKKSENTIKVYEQKNAIQKDITLGDYYIKKEYFEEKMKSFEVSAGDILVSCAGTIGETYVVPKEFEKGIINQALMRMTMVEELNIRYFLEYFDFILKKISNQLSNGSAIKNIPPFEIFKQLVIPIPPIEEQQRIVDKIDELNLTLNEIQKLENNLSNLKNQFPESIRNSILQDAFEGNWSEKKEWKEDYISDICIDISTGNSIPETTKKNKYARIQEGYNYIGTKDLEFDHSFNYENGVKIPYDEPKFRYANKNDILLCIEGGSAGKKIGILNEKVCYGNKLCKFQVHEDIEPKFLYYYLQSPMFLRNFFDKISGIIGGVSIAKIRKIKIKYPSKEEQIKIVNNIEKVLSMIIDITEINK